MSGLAKRVLFSTLLTVISTSSIAQEASKNSYADYRKNFKSKYNQFKEDYHTRYQAYKKELIEKWGVAELSSNTEYISYSADKNIKVIADFENDTIEVNLHQDADISADEVNHYVTKAIVDALDVTLSEVTEKNIEFDVTQYNTLTAKNLTDKQPITEEFLQSTSKVQATLLNHLGVKNTKQLTKALSNIEEIPASKQQTMVIKRTEKRLEKQIAQVKQFTQRQEISENQVKQAKEKVKELTTQLDDIEARKSQLTQKNVKSYRVQLKSERYNKAAQYLSTVEHHAKKWQLEQELLLAIMETESHFNPLAKSHIPAYGLMQIVPATAGMDVNKRVFSLEKKPSPQLLYNSNKNIQYGSAYFNILLTRYLKEVENPKSKMYCAIAAYNTGIGNLAKAFNNGERGRKKAIDKINQMTPEQVAGVISNKTHTETQRYLKKVLASRAYFNQHI